ncbi:hypothetical protein Nepgr_013430 [Nepenthes gracilis]|uniref:Uncharacterized protein n=1 Tax=Nepenthes gracilis TaxID=150966 RepID=A0AAD3SIW4_NEPGR|nr:hypothetical protein Nepgr_013430 [Nepenthes gracilis]
MASLLGAPLVPPQASASPLLPVPSRSDPFFPVRHCPLELAGCCRYGIWPAPGYCNLPVSIYGHICDWEQVLLSYDASTHQPSPTGWLPVLSRPGCKLVEMVLQLVWLATVLKFL